MTTIIQIIKDTINAVDPTLDLTGGSPETDLLITPGSLMMEPFIKQLQFLINNLGLTDPSNIEPTELDAIMGNFLQFRNQGSPSVGVVELFYNTPTSLDIPAGTIFTDTYGNTYTNTVVYYISSDTMAANGWMYPYYSTGPIAVTATVPGSATTIGPNQIVSTSLTPAPAAVTNPAGFAPGTDQETNLAFVVRAMNAVINGSLGSAAGIQNTLLTNFPTIQNISIKGMNDPEMLRDIVLSGINQYPGATVIDFYGKVSGLDDLPYPESLGYWTVFYDNPATSGIQPDLPTLADALENPFSTAQYAGLYKLNDAASTTIDNAVIFAETFSASAVPEYWSLSDTQIGIGSVKTGYEFGIDQISGGNMMRMGNRIDPTEVPQRSISVNVQLLLNVLNFMKVANTLPATAAANQPIFNSYEDFTNYYNN